MDTFDKEKHWENIYQTKNLKDLSWFESTPKISLDFFEQYNVSKTSKIIDIGGGDSFLVDHLLEMGYSDITVLDISASAINNAKKRLGERANMVKWVVSDAATFKPSEKYDFWHDRAKTAQEYINPEGVLVIGTFSDNGPTKCSGIEIKQYSEKSMTNRLKNFFENIRCIRIDHKTPFNTIQNFVFCSFKKLDIS